MPLRGLTFYSGCTVGELVIACKPCCGHAYRLSGTDAMVTCEKVDIGEQLVAKAACTNVLAKAEASCYLAVCHVMRYIMCSYYMCAFSTQRSYYL